MSNEDLFGGIPEDSKSPPSVGSRPQSPPRLMQPDRQQIRYIATDLESLLPEDHPARAI